MSVALRDRVGGIVNIQYAVVGYTMGNRDDTMNGIAGTRSKNDRLCWTLSGVLYALYLLEDSRHVQCRG